MELHNIYNKDEKIMYLKLHLENFIESLLITANVPIKYIQTQLGHSSCQVTLDIYSHILQEVEGRSVNILDDIV